MIFKGEHNDYEVSFEVGIDFGFWALPASICFIHLPYVGCLDSGFHTLLRVLCFQFSMEIWRWSHEVTDVGNSIEELFNGN